MLQRPLETHFIKDFDLIGWHFAKFPVLAHAVSPFRKSFVAGLIPFHLAVPELRVVMLQKLYPAVKREVTISPRTDCICLGHVIGRIGAGARKQREREKQWVMVSWLEVCGRVAPLA